MKSQKYSVEMIQLCCSEYRNGTPVSDICERYHIPRSTVYRWLQQYKSLPADIIPTKKELDNVRRKQERAEQICQILKLVNCAVSAPLQTKLYELEKLAGQFPIRILCDALDVDRGTFYNHLNRNKKENSTYAYRRQELSIVVKEVFEENRGLFGSDKILSVLQSRGYKTSKRMVRELMQEMGLRSLRDTAKNDYKTWVKLHETPNILRRQFNVAEPNRIWVSDCTQFKVLGKTYHICAILDLFSRKLIAYKISPRASTQLVTATFNLAFEIRKPTGSLMFHTDQGCQYTSQAFRKLLLKNNVTQSFSKPRTPYDNGVMESFFSSLKQEELYRTSYSSEKDFKRRVAAYMEFYNNIRPHRANKYKTPNQVETTYFNRLTTGGSEVDPFLDLTTI